MLHLRVPSRGRRRARSIPPHGTPCTHCSFAAPTNTVFSIYWTSRALGASPSCPDPHCGWYIFGAPLPPTLGAPANAGRPLLGAGCLRTMVRAQFVAACVTSGLPWRLIESPQSSRLRSRNVPARRPSSHAALGCDDSAVRSEACSVVRRLMVCHLVMRTACLRNGIGLFTCYSIVIPSFPF
jgi:hypothetical protein